MLGDDRTAYWKLVSILERQLEERESAQDEKIEHIDKRLRRVERDGELERRLLTLENSANLDRRLSNLEVRHKFKLTWKQAVFGSITALVTAVLTFLLTVLSPDSKEPPTDRPAEAQTDTTSQERVGGSGTLPGAD